MILLIDNYDSFTYNLYQAIGVLNPDIKVVRNDEITIEEIEKLDPQALVVSPGPCYPKDAGISVEAIRHFSGKLPIFGVCLGHQSIAEAFGGHIIHAAEQMHGKQTSIDIDNDQPIFKGLKNKAAMAAIAKISTTCKKPGDIKWNFTKFLVAKDGTVVKRYDPTSDPKTFAADIEALL